MINRVKEKTETAVIKSITCDVCKEEYKETFDLQEFVHLDFDCGYGSIFNDGNTIECDICQHCLKEKLGDYLRITEYGINC